MRVLEDARSEPRAATQTSLLTFGGFDESRASGVAARPKAGPASIPERINDRYVILRVLARGAMGMVLLARDEVNGDPVALKRPLTSDPRPSDVRRIQREAKTTAGLTHPNIVAVRDVSAEANGSPFFTMEHLRGESVRDVISKLRAGSPLATRHRSFEWRARVVLQVARALQHAHERGVMHRDVKPENVMVSAERAVLIDWGLATRGTRASASGRLARCRLRDRASSSDDDTVAGTPIYMAPEALRGAVNPQTDVYALAALLYELLTLRHYLPETPRGAFCTLAEQIDQMVPTPAHELWVPAQRRVPQALAKICARGLKKDPAKRHGSAGAVAEDIKRWLMHGGRWR